MPIFNKITYTKNEAIKWPIPNYWDVLAFGIVLSIIILLGYVGIRMVAPYQLGQVTPISLSIKYLPLYALHTVIRMFIGLFFALLFTFIFGAWAGKSKRAERVIIPLVDILQSVPVLSFLAITVTGFIALFRGSMLGPECAAIFAIFCAQTWNMTLSFYQSVRTVPHDLKEASKVFNLSWWQKFWRVEVPFAMPGLLWNIMMSMSGSWFFVTASEAFSVANQRITLPGVGSYIAVAINNANLQAIFYAIVTMLLVILLYDQLLFRPLAQWVEKFKFESSVEDGAAIPESWVVNLCRRTVLLRNFTIFLSNFSEKIVNFRTFKSRDRIKKRSSFEISLFWRNFVYYFLLEILVIGSLAVIGYYLLMMLNFSELKRLLFLGSYTGIRVMILVMISSLIWVPVGVWIGLRPRVANVIQPIVQFLAAFPANLTFPVVAILIVKYNLNVEIWASPLMVLGTQWYILFNVIAGTLALPKDLTQVTATLGVNGLLRWRKLVMPAIFPYFLTGAITAAGGAWNASIIAEAISWGNINLQATGLGSFIKEAAQKGDFSEVILGTIVMCIFVVLINRLLWRPLYNLAVKKFSLS